MSIHNIQFHDKIRFCLNIPKYFFMSYRKSHVGLKNEFESAMVIKPSVFQLLKFYCT